MQIDIRKALVPNKIERIKSWDEERTDAHFLVLNGIDSHIADRYDGSWSLIKILHKGIAWTFEAHNGEIIECVRIGN